MTDVIFRPPRPREEDCRWGKWSLPGVPHRGWSCVEMVDVEDDMITCEMCESAEVRYVHVMRHPEWEGELNVGCVCAGNMEQDYGAAKQRESWFKRKNRVEVAAAQGWVEAANEILAMAAGTNKLSAKEESFVRDMRARALKDANPRKRKFRDFTPKQMGWFKAIYLRVVKPSEERREEWRRKAI